MQTREVCVVTYSAITIVNAIPALRGAALGIEIPVRICVEELPSYSQDIIDAADRNFIKYLIDKFRSITEIRNKFRVVIRSEIPTGAGLKSSSSVSAGLIIGLAAAAGIDMNFMDCLRISCIASREYGVSVTGALDDASASVLGGLVYTDNKLQVIEEHVDVEDRLYALVFTLKDWARPRDFSSRIQDLRTFREVFNRIFIFSKKDPYNAALVNSLYVCHVFGYNYGTIARIMRDYKPECVGLSGNGPAIFVVDKDVEKLRRLVSKYFEQLSYYKIVRVLPIVRDASMSVLDVR